LSFQHYFPPKFFCHFYSHFPLLFMPFLDKVFHVLSESETKIDYGDSWGPGWFSVWSSDKCTGKRLEEWMIFSESPISYTINATDFYRLLFCWIV
jgi:hypothetical protein